MSRSASVPPPDRRRGRDCVAGPRAQPERRRRLVPLRAPPAIERASPRRPARAASHLRPQAAPLPPPRHSAPPLLMRTSGTDSAVWCPAPGRSPQPDGLLQRACSCVMIDQTHGSTRENSYVRLAVPCAQHQPKLRRGGQPSLRSTPFCAPRSGSARMGLCAAHALSFGALAHGGARGQRVAFGASALSTGQRRAACSSRLEGRAFSLLCIREPSVPLSLWGREQDAIQNGELPPHPSSAREINKYDPI